MDQETVERRAEMAEEFYNNIYGDLIGSEGFAAYTSPEELESYIEKNSDKASPDTIKRLKKILGRIREDPSRARHFSITKQASILYVPDDDAIALFEEVFHSLSRLDSYTEETYAPLATYTAALWADQNGWIYEYTPMELVEKATGKERVESFQNEYRGRKTSYELLEFFTEGKNGEPLGLEDVAKISKKVYSEILESNESAEKVIRKAIPDMEE